MLAERRSNKGASGKNHLNVAWLPGQGAFLIIINGVVPRKTKRFGVFKLARAKRQIPVDLLIDRIEMKATLFVHVGCKPKNVRAQKLLEYKQHLRGSTCRQLPQLSS